MAPPAYGTWPSPIDAALAASQDGRPEYVGTVGDEVWWTEPRPAEGGRRALVRRRADGREEPVLPAPWNVRSRVIEYGGRPWAGTARPAGGPLVVFVNFADQRLYATSRKRRRGAAAAHPVSPVGGGLRWAEPESHRNAVKSGASWRSSPATAPPMCAGSWPRCRWTARRPGTAAPCANSPTAGTGSSPAPALARRAARGVAGLGPSRGCRGTARS